MGLPHFNNAFCGKPLRTGSLIVGWFITVFVGIVWTIYLSLLPTLFDYYDEKGLIIVPGISTNSYNNGVHSSTDYQVYSFDRGYAESVYEFRMKASLNRFRMKASLFGVLLTYVFIMQCFLLWGVIKKKLHFLKVWIFTTVLMVSIGALASCILIILAFLDNKVFILVVIPLCIFNGVVTYCLLVINSYYQEIKDENTRNENSTNVC